VAFASGAGVIIAQARGARNEREVERSVHTSMTFAIVFGVGLAALSIAIGSPILKLMGTQDEFFDNAYLYLFIICLGIPASSIYNFGAAILRSVGDSKTSLYILSVSGLINVGLNLVFVCVFGMAVDGVALATIIAQYISATVVVIVLIRRKGESYALVIKKLRLETSILKRIMRIAIPIAFQNLLFSISNIVVTAAVNTFPPEIVKAKAVAFSIEGITYTAMHSFSHASMTFVGQNFGAKKYSRINKTLIYSVLQVAVTGILISQIEIFFGEPLAYMFIGENEANPAAVVSATIEIFNIMLATYFLCGIMEVVSGVLKGLGFSTTSMIACLIGLGFRVWWLLFVTPTESFHTVFGLFVCYTISWILTIILLAICCVYAWRKLGIMRGAREEKRASLNNDNTTEEINV
jgi:putative MATE family efflux protein